MTPMIRVQAEDVDVGIEIGQLAAECPDAGAIASFVGRVRGEGGLTAMTLEHYPGMTERQIEAIAAEARGRWPLFGVRVIHRYGRLLPGETIVLVAVASAHRADAFAACEFLMDWLKTKAPFWKHEEGPAGGRWVEAKADDEARARRWEKDAGNDSR